MRPSAPANAFLSLHLPHAPRQHELTETMCTPDELLWLRTLERYSHTCKHWAAAMPGNKIPECPVYRPTAEEFAEPGEYFKRILPQVRSPSPFPCSASPSCGMPRSQMEPYGICKVVPPPGWTPEPWSGRQPQGAGTTEWRGLRGNTVELCKALSGNAVDGDLMVTPRVQQLQLFSKSFEPYATDLTLQQARARHEVD